MGPKRGMAACLYLIVFAPLLLTTEARPFWRWAWAFGFAIGVVGFAVYFAWWRAERRQRRRARG